MRECSFLSDGAHQSHTTGHNTAIADGTSQSARADELKFKKAMALTSRPLPWLCGVVAPPSKISLIAGGHLPVHYSSENFKPQHLDEYTGEPLPTALIQAAIIEELDYFNDRVWSITTKDEMHKLINKLQ